MGWLQKFEKGDNIPRKMALHDVGVILVWAPIGFFIFGGLATLLTYIPSLNSDAATPSQAQQSSQNGTSNSGALPNSIESERTAALNVAQYQYSSCVSQAQHQFDWENGQMINVDAYQAQQQRIASDEQLCESHYQATVSALQ